MVPPEKSPANTPKQFADWCAIISVWQKAETEPGIRMYDYGEADREVQSEESDRAGELSEANRGWMFNAGGHRWTVNVGLWTVNVGLWRQSLSCGRSRLAELAPVDDVVIC
jgi:hypothetical protein